MISRLIILLLIVGCEEPKGICISYIGQGDVFFSEIDSLYLITEINDFNIECNNNNTLDECCFMGYKNKINSHAKICKGGISNAIFPPTSFSDTMGIAYPTVAGIVTSNISPEFWIENESCSQHCQEADCD